MRLGKYHQLNLNLKRNPIPFCCSNPLSTEKPPRGLICNHIIWIIFSFVYETLKVIGQRQPNYVLQKRKPQQSNSNSQKLSLLFYNFQFISCSMLMYASHVWVTFKNLPKKRDPSPILRTKNNLSTYLSIPMKTDYRISFCLNRVIRSDNVNRIKIYEVEEKRWCSW